MYTKVDLHPNDLKGFTMKGNEKIITLLNGYLADELAAISQYMVHSEMCADWGYGKLHESVEKRAIGEMKHAEKLIGRILFLEGQPTVSKPAKITIGDSVETQLKNDLASEAQAIQDYNEGVRLCAELGDNGTLDLITANLKDEEEHLDWLETQIEQIGQMGLQNYLLSQAG
jgi:bacterioferritin